MTGLKELRLHAPGEINVLASGQKEGVSLVSDRLFTPPFVDAAVERRAQDKKWGEQNHPDFASMSYPIHSAADCRQSCQAAFARGEGNWYSILLEEVAEAGEERDNPEALREELIQVAAVALAWVDCIDRRNEA